MRAPTIPWQGDRSSASPNTPEALRLLRLPILCAAQRLRPALHGDTLVEAQQWSGLRCQGEAQVIAGRVAVNAVT